MLTKGSALLEMVTSQPREIEIVLPHFTHEETKEDILRNSNMAQMVKNPPAMWDTWVRSLGWEYPWRRAWQLTPVYLPGESPWTEEPGGLQSMGSQRVRHDWSN